MPVIRLKQAHLEVFSVVTNAGGTASVTFALTYTFAPKVIATARSTESGHGTFAEVTAVTTTSCSVKTWVGETLGALGGNSQSPVPATVNLIVIGDP